MTAESAPPRRRRWLRVAVAAAVIGAVAYFFTRTLLDHGTQLRAQHIAFGWWAVGATVAFVLAVLVSGWLWGRIVTVLEQAPLSRREAVRVHVRSWLLKYIPGQVGFVVNKVLWARGRGSSRMMALVSVVYENAFLLLGSTVPMLAILVLARPGATEISSTVWLVLAAVVPLVAVTHPAVFRRVVALLGRRLKAPVPERYFLSSRATWRFQAEFLVPRIVNGVGVVLIAVAIAEAPASSWVPLVAAYALAGAAGIVAVFVPSGLGVREAVFVLFAGPYLGLEQAILVALAARVLATVADAVLAGLLPLLRPRSGREVVGTIASGTEAS